MIWLVAVAVLFFFLGVGIGTARGVRAEQNRLIALGLRRLREDNGG